MKKFGARKLILMLADIFIISVSGITLNYILSFFRDTAIYYPPEASKGLLYYIVIAVLTCELMQLLLGSYTVMWRYFNIRDYFRCGGAMTGGFVIAYLVLMMLHMAPRKIFFVLFFVTATLGVLLFRFLFPSRNVSSGAYS